MITTTTVTRNPNLLGTGGAYLRVSDDGQDIATQRKTISDFEARHGVTLDPRYVYEDVAWSRDEFDRRPSWLRMLADVSAGKIQWLVIAAKDRAATADPEEKLILYRRLRKAGCKLILATTDQVLNTADIASLITALLDGQQEQAEVRIKSDRALEKMAQHAERGRWLGGQIPYGFDVICTDITGKSSGASDSMAATYASRSPRMAQAKPMKGKTIFPLATPASFLP